MKYLSAIIITLFYLINVPAASKVYLIEPARQSIGKVEGVELFV